MNRSRCSTGEVSSQGIDQPPVDPLHSGVTHVPGLFCYLCTRFVPRRRLKDSLGKPENDGETLAGSQVLDSRPIAAVFELLGGAARSCSPGTGEGAVHKVFGPLPEGRGIRTLAVRMGQSHSVPVT